MLAPRTDLLTLTYLPCSEAPWARSCPTSHPNPDPDPDPNPNPNPNPNYGSSLGSLTPNILAEMPAEDSFSSDLRGHLAVPKVTSDGV